MTRPVLSICLALALAPLAVARAEEGAVDLLWGVKIPLRDGVKLNATVYRPPDLKTPLPVIFTLTPYIGDSYHNRAL